MTIEELKELFSDLLNKDIRPLLCDTKVPFIDTNVSCGEPRESYDDMKGSVLLPKELLSMHPEFMVPVKGDSMKDVGIVAGDVVKIVADVVPSDGDIVLASIDGEYTLKAYCEDDDGQHWLVPQNENYAPIRIDEGVNVRIIGRVKEVVKSMPRVSYRQCLKIIRKKRMAELRSHEISPLRVGAAIREIATLVEVARQWYAVYRVMVDLNVIAEDAYDTFIEMVKQEVPHHQSLPTRAELLRMAVDSFSKPVASWRPDNSPVKGKRYQDYLKIARRTEELLTAA